MRVLANKDLQLIRSLSPKTLRTLAEHVPFPSLFIQLADALESQNPTEEIHKTLHNHRSLLEQLHTSELPNFDPQRLHERIQELFSKQEQLQETEQEIQLILDRDSALKEVWEVQGQLKDSLLSSSLLDIIHQLADGISNPQKHQDLDTDKMLQDILIQQKNSWNDIDKSLVKLSRFVAEKDRPDLSLHIQYQRLSWHQNHLGADVDTLLSIWEDVFAAAIKTKDWSNILRIGQHIKQAALLLNDEPLFDTVIHRLSMIADERDDRQRQILFLLEEALHKSTRQTKSKQYREEVERLIFKARDIYNGTPLPKFIGARILLSSAQVLESRQELEPAKKIYKRILRIYKDDVESFSSYIRAALNLGRIDILEDRISLGSERIAFAYHSSKRLKSWPLFSATIQACLDCAKLQNDTKTQERLLQEGAAYAQECYDAAFANEALRYWKQTLS